MKFGIFYELQLPRPWGPDDERQLYQNALDQVELADRLGYDYAWEVEHHFLEEYSHSPAPEVFLGAASQRTKNIRLGHGIVQLTTNPPQRVAERIAALDLVSNGRVEMGTGKSASDHRTRRLRPRHGDQARGLGRRAPLHHPDVQGPGRRARHQVAQDADAQRAAEAGAEAAPAAVGRVLAARDDRDGRPARTGRAGLPVPVARTPRTPGCTPTTTGSSSSRRSWPTTRPIRTSRWSATSCAPRPTRRRGVARTVRRSSSSRCASTVQAPAGSGRIPTPSTCGTNTTSGSARTPRRRRARISGGLIGSPETLRRKLRRFDTSNIDQVILLNQAGKNSHPHICESLELFAQGGDAGIPRQRTGAPGMEAQRAGARDRTGRDRYHAVSRAVRPEHGAGPGAARGRIGRNPASPHRMQDRVRCGVATYAGRPVNASATATVATKIPTATRNGDNCGCADAKPWPLTGAKPVDGWVTLMLNCPRSAAQMRCVHHATPAWL